VLREIDILLNKFADGSKPFTFKDTSEGRSLFYFVAFL